MYEQQIENDYTVDDSQYTKSYSSAAEWFVFFVILFALLEAIFFNYLQGPISERSAWWARLTPWNLYPTEILFFGILLIPSFFITLRGRKFGYQTSRGLWIVGAIFLVGTLQAIHGWAAGDRRLLWLTDYRQLFLMTIFVPFFWTLASGIRLWKLADRLCRVGVFLAIYSGTVGVLLFMGVIDRESPLAPGQWSQQTLILLYLFLLIKSIVSGKMETFKLILFAFGILAPLQKTPLASFVVLHLIAIFILIFWIRYQKISITLRATKVFLVLGFCLVLAAPVFLGLGEGAAKRWLAYRWLKEGTPGADVTSGRLRAWQWGIDQWINKPFLGNGLGHHMTITTAEGEVRELVVHNIVITVLYQTGFIGFVICVSAFLVWFIRMKRFLRNCLDPDVLWPALAMYIFCATVLVASLAGQSIGIPYVGFVFWICFAMLTDAEAQHYMDALYSNDYEEDNQNDAINY
jgi:hypothetical protein